MPYCILRVSGLLLLTLFFCLTTHADDFEFDDDVFSDLGEHEEKRFKWPVFTLAYQFADGMENDGIRVRRADARIQWDQLFFEDWFVRFDGKVLYYHGIDQQLGDEESHDFDWRLRDLYLQKSLAAVSITLGQQLLVWGELDSLSVTDVVSPWDFSEFVFTAPEDARLGQPMLVTQWYGQAGSIQFFYSPWPEVNRYPGGDAEGAITMLTGADFMSVREETPELGREHEVGIRWQYHHDAYEFKLMAARLYSNEPTFVFRSLTKLRAFYEAFKMLGLSANYAMPNFLWKFEAALKWEQPVATLGLRDIDSREFAAGVDYDANGAYVLAFESRWQHFKGEIPDSIEDDDIQSALRWNKQFLHDTLSVTWFSNYQWKYKDIIHSLHVLYDFSDIWNIEANVTLFDSRDEDAPGQLTEDWDQFTIRVSAGF